MNASSEQRQTSSGTAFRRLAGILAGNLASVLAVFFLNIALSLDSPNAWTARSFVIALVYANCVGSLAALTLPYLVPRFRRQGSALSWTLYLGAMLVITAIGCLLSVLILTLIGIFPRRFYWSFAASSVGLAVLISIAIGVSRYIYEGVRANLRSVTRELRAKELEEERARKLAVEARLSSLESRVHPHFLFNTLNSISSLIQEDPERAERMVEQLAALLRFSLDSNEHRRVTLRQELKIVRDYLEIERARFGERLRYSIDLPPELELAEVPTMSVQTLVENSVKYAVSPRREGAQIRVSARTAADRLTIEVSDDGPGFSVDDMVVGHGLDSLQSRLAGLFDNQAGFDISRKEGLTRVTLSLPLKQSLAPATV